VIFGAHSARLWSSVCTSNIDQYFFRDIRRRVVAGYDALDLFTLPFLSAVRVLSCVFRGKFIAALRRSFQRNQLVFHGVCLPLAQEKASSAFVRSLFRQEWIAYAKPPFGGPEHVLRESLSVQTS